MPSLAVLLSIAIFSNWQEDLGSRLENHIRAYSDRGEFQGAVLVAKDGEIIYQGGFGYANLESGTENTVETQFLIGSTTKSFYGK